MVDAGAGAAEVDLSSAVDVEQLRGNLLVLHPDGAAQVNGDLADDPTRVDWVGLLIAVGHAPPARAGGRAAVEQNLADHRCGVERERKVLQGVVHPVQGHRGRAGRGQCTNAVVGHPQGVAAGGQAAQRVAAVGGGGGVGLRAVPAAVFVGVDEDHRARRWRLGLGAAVIGAHPASNVRAGVPTHLRGGRRPRHFLHARHHLGDERD